LAWWLRSWAIVAAAGFAWLDAKRQTLGWLALCGAACSLQDASVRWSVNPWSRFILCFFGGAMAGVKIEFDGPKQVATLAEPGLDFARADDVFASKHLTRIDSRQDYAEDRFATTGWLDGRLVILVCTPRGEARRIISMRKANEREIKTIDTALG